MFNRYFDFSFFRYPIHPATILKTGCVCLSVLMFIWISGCAAPPPPPNGNGDGNGDPPDIPILEPPTADAGPDRTVIVGQEVILRGRSSTDTEGTYTFNWLQTAGPQVALEGANTAEARFIPIEVGVYVLELTVGNAQGADTDSVTITATEPDAILPPIANAGLDRTVRPGIAVSLDGRGSFDPGGGPLFFQWRQISGPTVMLHNLNSATPSFTSPQVADAAQLIFELYVRNQQQYDDVDTVTITVSPQNDLPNQVTLILNTHGQGSIDIPGGVYEQGTELILTAIPDPGWIFDRWEGDLEGNVNPATVVLNSNKQIIAVFIDSTQVASPMFSIPSNSVFATSLVISMTTATPDAVIYYTLDETDPTPGSLQYTGPITLYQHTTIRARAFKEGMTPSAVSESHYYGMLVPGS